MGRFLCDAVVSSGSNESNIVPRRIINSVVDKFLYRVPGFASLLDLFHARPTPRSGCLDLLKEGRLLALSPGGTYEAQLGDSR